MRIDLSLPLCLLGGFGASAASMLINLPWSPLDNISPSLAGALSLLNEAISNLNPTWRPLNKTSTLLHGALTPAAGTFVVLPMIFSSNRAGVRLQQS